MNEKCRRTKRFISVKLGLHRNYIYKEVSQKEIFSFCDTSCSATLPLPSRAETLIKILLITISEVIPLNIICAAQSKSPDGWK